MLVLQSILDYIRFKALKLDKKQLLFNSKINLNRRSNL